MYRYLLGRPLSREESEEQLGRYRRHWDEHGFGLWGVEEKATGRLVGRAGLSFHRLWPQDPELGWMLDPNVWGRGYATEAGRAGLAAAFGGLGFERVISIVHPENERSFAVAARLGMTPWRELLWPGTGISLRVLALGRPEWSRLQSSG